MLVQLQGTLHRMSAKLESAAGNPEDLDRGAVIEPSIGPVLVAAGGAGGQSAGAAAAIMAAASVRQEENSSIACP